VGTAKRARQDANRAIKREQEAKQERRDQVVTRSKRLGLYVVGFVLLLAFALFLTRDRWGGDDDDGDVAAAATTTVDPASTTVDPNAFQYGTTPCPPAEGTAEPVREFDDSFERCIDPARTYAARITTNMGDIVLELDPVAAPGTVNNFVALARSKFYDGLTVHRVAPEFVIQGGDPAGDGSGGPGYTIADELPSGTDSSEIYSRGSLAMANAGPNTNGSQWFIVSGSWSATLPANYSRFGEVAGDDSLETVDAIAALNDGTDGPPTETVTIESITITEG
jgi:cyclophilin family peptidyl-prolyl cis-trans isomerase